MQEKMKCANCKHWNRTSGKCLSESFDINSGDTSIGFLAIMKRDWGQNCKHWITVKDNPALKERKIRNARNSANQ